MKNKIFFSFAVLLLLLVGVIPMQMSVNSQSLATTPLFAVDFGTDNPPAQLPLNVPNPAIYSGLYKNNANGFNVFNDNGNNVLQVTSKNNEKFIKTSGARTIINKNEVVIVETKIKTNLVSINNQNRISINFNNLQSGTGTALKVSAGFNPGKLESYTGLFMGAYYQSYSADTWYTIKYVIKPQTNKMDVYVDGVIKGKDVIFNDRANTGPNLKQYLDTDSLYFDLDGCQLIYLRDYNNVDMSLYMDYINIYKAPVNYVNSLSVGLNEMAPLIFPLPQENEYTFVSNDMSKATVDNKGIVNVIGGSVGDKVYIDMKNSYGEFIGNSEIIIAASNPITAITPTMQLPVLCAGNNQKTTVNATKTPANANGTIYYSSSDENIATVDQSGIITAVGVGNAYIIAHTWDGSVEGRIPLKVIGDYFIDPTNLTEFGYVVTANAYTFFDGNYTNALTTIPPSSGDGIPTDTIKFPTVSQFVYQGFDMGVNNQTAISRVLIANTTKAYASNALSGCRVQGSMTGNETEYTDLVAIGSANDSGFTEFVVRSPDKYRFFRVVVKKGQLSEALFFAPNPNDVLPSSGEYRLTGQVVESKNDAGSLGGYSAFDGFVGSYFEHNVTGPYTGIDLGVGNERPLSSIRYLARPDYETRMVNGKFQASNDGQNWVDIYTITIAPTKNQFAFVDHNNFALGFDNSIAYRYYKFVPAVGQAGGNPSEIEFYTPNISISNAITKTNNTLSLDISKIKNNDYYNRSANFILAVYDANNVLTNVSISDNKYTVNGILTQTISNTGIVAIDDIQNVNNLKVKVFSIDEFSNMRPISKEFSTLLSNIE